ASWKRSAGRRAVPTAGTASRGIDRGDPTEEAGAMMGKAVQDAINEQIMYELYSGYTYLAMSAYFEEQGLPGFAKWMRLQAQEELKHAMRLFDHVAERGGHITLHAVDAPPASFDSPLDVFEKALAHEQH